MTSTTSPDGVGDIGRQRIVDQLRVAPGTLPTWPDATLDGRAAVRTIAPLQWPTVSEKDRAANAKARQELEAEPD